MRIRSIEVKNHPPVLDFAVDQLSDVIVLAGPNGVGKTRLIEALNQKFQNPTGFGNVAPKRAERVLPSEYTRRPTALLGRPAP